ncbi:stalk domain-containing protein [Paenibacillus sp. HB172176]|uniref:stalk domain-containing protein n=1 Tax=Paenibacillus sp. HB172176 TaxID=2493690 RepID=UPI00143A7BBA|nr:stalk domain-containing protein [Paenibacillus sp. HB172176]
MRKYVKNKAVLSGTLAVCLSLVASPVVIHGEAGARGIVAASGVSSNVVTNVHLKFRDIEVTLSDSPVLVNSTMMVPALELFQGLGYTVTYDDELRKLTATRDRTVLIFWEGKQQAQWNGNTVENLPAAPYTESDKLWVPLRFIAEASELSVSWDEASRLATVFNQSLLTPLNVFTKNDGDEDISTDKLKAYMKSRTKLDADLSFTGVDHYRDKTFLKIAAGDMDSLMLIEDANQLADDMLSSITMELSEGLQGYPELQKLADARIGSRSLADGSLVGIARPFDPHDAPFPAVRQDWLDILGLSQPSTLDELKQVLESFEAKDPDGNGKHDTIPLTGYAGGLSLGTFQWVEQAFTGEPERFSLENGKAIDHALSDEEIHALQWLRDAYEENLIDKEFSVQTKAQYLAKLQKEQTGVAALTLDEAAALSAHEGGANADWLPLSSVRADDNSEPIAPWNSRGSGTYIVSVMSKLPLDEVLNWYSEGIAMTKNNGWLELEDWSEEDQAAAERLFGRFDMLAGNSRLDAMSNEQQAQYQSAAEQWRELSYSATMFPEAQSVTSSNKYVELNSTLNQMKLKFIMGAISESEWRSYTASLASNAAYMDMMAELNALAASLKR